MNPRPGALMAATERLTLFAAGLESGALGSLPALHPDNHGPFAADLRALLTRLSTVEAERDEARRGCAHLAEREAHFAKVLGVCDGGQYRNDWDARIAAFVARAQTLEATLTRVKGERDYERWRFFKQRDEMLRSEDRNRTLEAESERRRVALESFAILANDDTLTRVKGLLNGPHGDDEWGDGYRQAMDDVRAALQPLATDGVK